MSKNLTSEDSMEKKIFAPKGCLQQLEPSASRPRQDASSLGGGNQVSATTFGKSRNQRRGRRDTPSGHGPVNFRPEPSGQKNPSSKGNRKGKNEDDAEQVDEKDNDRLNRPAEFGSLQLPGSKKHNLNHLLNFHFTPRESQGRVSSSHSHHHSSRTGLRPKQMHDSFIQANCQFVVASDDDVEYHVDLPINWKSVEQIIIRTYGGTPACPICLCSPSAAKITKCGHVFCWSCILRYFSYGDRRNSHPCPICFHLINPLELKSVVANLVEEVHVGDMMKLQLMCRKKDCTSTYSMPISSKLGGCVNGWEKRFQKLLRLTPKQVQSEVLEREHLELSLQLDLTIESLETEFVLAAMTDLETRMKILLDKITNPGCSNKSELNVGEMKDYGNSKVATPENLANNEAEAGVELNLNSECKMPPIRQAVNWEEYSFFYQAADGSNVFMNPMNMAMFWKNFGPNPSEWPQTIALKVVELELLAVTAELRKRFKFLQYVPLSSPIQLLEFELKGTVSKDVMGEFSHQLNERKRRRSERARAEKRRERLQQEAERMANVGPHKPQIESLHDFPECRSPEAEAQALEYAIQASLAETQGDIDFGQEASTPRTSFSSSELSTFPDTQQRPCPSLSFAQALNTPSQWKTRPSQVGPTTKVSSSIGPSSQRDNSQNQADEDGSQIPAFRASVSDAIASAFANFNLNESVTADHESSQSSSGQKKKGRKKGKVLFATAMGMGSN